jgi:hypothetical protein
MIRTLASAAACLLMTLAPAQDTAMVHPIEGRFDAFTTDELGNIYALQGDVLELFTPDGHSWLRNSVKTFGRINTIDAFYSLKPMLFSAEQGQVAVLDNTLSLQGSVLNLPRDGYPQVVLVCMSVQNAFWFFDQRELALVRVDAQLRPLANTGRLDQLLGFTPKPLSMQEHESRLYVNDPEEGILVFDLFGTYTRTIPVKGATSFEVRGNVLFFFAEGRFQVYDMRSFEVLDYPLPWKPAGEILDARAERGHVYVRLADRLVIMDVPRER